MSTLTATIQADTSGFNSAVQRASNELKLFDKSNRNLADTMRRTNNVSDLQVQAFNKSVRSLQQVSAGFRTNKQSVKSLKDELERLTIQYNNLSNKNSTFARTLSSTINSVRNELSTLDTPAKTVNNSFSSMSTALGKIGPIAAGIGAAVSALPAAIDIGVSSSETFADNWEKIKTKVESVKNTIASFFMRNNFSDDGFFSSLSRALDQAGRLADALDRLGTVTAFNSAAIAESKSKLSDFKEIYSTRNLTETEKKEVKKEIENLKNLSKSSETSGLNAAKKTINSALANKGIDTDDPVIKTFVEEVIEDVRKEGVAAWDKLIDGKFDIFGKAVKIKISTKSDKKATEIQAMLENTVKAFTEAESDVTKGFLTYVQALDEGRSNTKFITSANKMLEDRNKTNNKENKKDEEGVLDQIKAQHQENAKLEKELEDIRIMIEHGSEKTPAEKVQLYKNYTKTANALIAGKKKTTSMYESLQSPQVTPFWDAKLKIDETFLRNQTLDIAGAEGEVLDKIINQALEDAAKELAEAIKKTGLSLEEYFTIVEEQKNLFSTSGVSKKNYTDDPNVTRLISLTRAKYEENEEKEREKEREKLKNKFKFQEYKPVTQDNLNTEIEAVNKLAGAWENLWSAIDTGNDTLNRTMSAMGATVSDFANTFVQLSKIQFQAAQATALAKGNESASGLPVPYNFAAMATVTSFIMSTFARFKNIGRFANGGIISGASTIGDYNIARVNSGEMILNGSQQKRLFNIINNGEGVSSTQSAPQEVKLRVEGKDLVATLNTYNNRMKKVQ